MAVRTRAHARARKHTRAHTGTNAHLWLTHTHTHTRARARTHTHTQVSLRVSDGAPRDEAVVWDLNEPLSSAAAFAEVLVAEAEALDATKPSGSMGGDVGGRGVRARAAHTSVCIHTHTHARTHTHTHAHTRTHVV